MARQVDAALVHLFRYDASDHTLTLHLTYLKGKLRQGTSNDECELFAAPFPADITPAFELMCQHRQFMTPEATPIPVEEFAWPGALEWLADIQASDAAHMVLFVGDTPVGTMGLAFTDGKTLQKEDQPLVRALSQQCAIALRLSDLAERSQQAAIAREQEKAALERAAELESLNAALRRETRERCQAEEVIRSQNSALKHSLERLLQEPDIRGFLGALLDTLMTQLQGHAANIWLLQDDRTTLTLWTAFALERLHTNPEETLLPYEPIPVALVAQTILSVKAGWQQTIHYSGDDPRLPLPLQEFHKRDRVCSVLTTPLRLGHHRLGWLAFVTQEDLQQMPSDKVAFLEAIAHQATLAVHLHHLAEEAKQAAIAREQEKAAQERAAELAKANHALRESLGSLATNPELDTFLGYMLLEMATQINAAKNHLFLYDQSTHTLSLHIFVRDGKVFSKEANDFELFAQPIPADITPAWRLMIQQKSSLNLALEQDNPNFWSGTYEWHRAQGHQGVLCVPLILGEEPLGFLGLSFTAKAMLSPQEIELAQALAHQVTLAIQLTRLAEESRQAAILEERNRMAQEIHDTLAQAFAGIGIQLQAATRFRTTNPDKAQIHCDRAHALAQTGLTEARRSVWALSQEGLEYSDLSASVTRIAEQLTAGTSLQPNIEVQGTPYSVEPEVGLNLLRIAQEALSNALRHAQAQTIQIQITYEPSYVRLGVRDDGRGFDPQLPVQGFGLASMQQRVDHIGAQLLVSSQLGAGTEIAVILLMDDCSSC
jgi:signal transduction histidine kinase